MQIDDPIDAARAQNPEEPTNIVLELACKALTVIHPLTSFGNSLREHFSRQAKFKRFENLVSAVEIEVRRQGKKIEDLEEKTKTAGFQEAFIVAATETVQTTNDIKIRRYGSILGYSLVHSVTEDDWDEATAFIADLSRFTEKDIEALSILNITQGNLVALNAKTLDPNAFTDRLPEVRREVILRGLTEEEFYSRCGRLAGFGLALETQRNNSRMAPGDHCFRLTVRGKRLARALRADQD